MDELLLQGREEALDRRVVPAVRTAAHAANHPMTGRQPLVVFAGVLATPVRVRHESLAGEATGQRQLQGVDDQPAVDPRAHRPAHDPLRVQVLRGRQIQPTLARRDVRHIGRPDAVGRHRLELPVDDVLGHGAVLVRVGRASELPLRLGGDPVLAHQSGHRVYAASLAPGDQLAVDPQDPAHQPDRPSPPVAFDEAVPHDASLAKKAVALCRMSRSIVSRLFSARRRRSS